MTFLIVGAKVNHAIISPLLITLLGTASYIGCMALIDQIDGMEATEEDKSILFMLEPVGAIMGGNTLINLVIVHSLAIISEGNKTGEEDAPYKGL